jgi:2-methylaconitate cis-trans-isomerase PrpF
MGSFYRMLFRRTHRNVRIVNKSKRKQSNVYYIYINPTINQTQVDLYHSFNLIIDHSISLPQIQQLFDKHNLGTIISMLVVNNSNTIQVSVQWSDNIHVQTMADNGLFNRVPVHIPDSIYMIQKKRA